MGKQFRHRGLGITFVDSCRCTIHGDACCNRLQLRLSCWTTACLAEVRVIRAAVHKQPWHYGTEKERG